MKEKPENTVSVPGPRLAVIEMILAGNRVQEHMAEVLKPYHLSLAQFNVLRILRGQKGKPASLSCINKKMIHKMSNTTRLVDKLLEKGLVDRIVCPENRRQVEISITTKGMELLGELDNVIDKAEAALVKDFNEREIELLIQLLKKTSE